MSKNVAYTTKQEMDDFISGLFEDTNPVPDPDWEKSLPDESILVSEGAEFVSASEVKSFITDLFK